MFPVEKKGKGNYTEGKKTASCASNMRFDFHGVYCGVEMIGRAFNCLKSDRKENEKPYLISYDQVWDGRRFEREG